MATLLDFPSPPIRPRALRLVGRGDAAPAPLNAASLPFSGRAPIQPRARLQTVDIFWIGRRLGRERAAPRTLVPLIRLLIGQRGFPAPLDVRCVKGALVEGADAVQRGSRWSLAEAQAWFDNARPAQARAELQSETVEWTSRLDARAAELAA